MRTKENQLKVDAAETKLGQVLDYLEAIENPNKEVVKLLLKVRELTPCFSDAYYSYKKQGGEK